MRIFFYSSQPTDEADLKIAAGRSLYMAMAYHNELGMQDVVYLEDEREIPLSSNSSALSDPTFVNSALKDLGLVSITLLTTQRAWIVVKGGGDLWEYTASKGGDGGAFVCLVAKGGYGGAFRSWF
ncbi:hypothetical protein Tco_1055211 [Tanacetum coccineum]|uniref:Uncharacterized protein n=1 Tax=Tanacetum coccineum TaxID=301880 RepID=A0ABQ5GZZ5_9ASTR